MDSTRWALSGDAKRILLAQALRAAGYGFGAVLLGATLDSAGWSPTRVGVLLTALVAGSALASFATGRFGDRIGRRALYALLFSGLALSGLVFGLTDNFWALSIVALTGTLSTEVVESGPFTSLEQAMLPATVDRSRTTRVFGTYNAIATVFGSFGALAAGGPSLLRDLWPGAPHDQRFFLLLLPVGVVGAALALSLSDKAETGRRAPDDFAPQLHLSRAPVLRLAGLFALDSIGGGFVIQTFIAYWFSVRFDASLETLGAIFFAVGLLQSVSFLIAVRLSERIGLLNTMVFTHLPSNLLLAAIPLAPSLPIAVALLLARFTLSQMDVPTRQAYLAALATPAELTAAAAYTNTARTAARPLGPLLGSAVQHVAIGAPFVIGAGLKIIYDVMLWGWFRSVPLEPSPDRQAVRRTKGVPGP